MRIAVTGAKGQLGREWIGFLQVQNVEVQGFGSKELDITDTGQINEILTRLNPDVVINCAAYTDVDGAEEEPEKAFKVNETGVKTLAEWCSEKDVRLVHFSTDYVFPGRMSDRDKYPSGYPETAETDPVNRYGASKLAGEKALLESAVKSLLVRVSWLCGKYGSNFVKTMIRLGREKKSLNVVNDQFGSPSYTSDVVRLTFELLKRGEIGIFHLTSAGLISWFDFANEIFSNAGIDVELNAVSSDHFQTKAIRPAYSKLSSEKLENTIGRSVTDWKTGLKNLLEEIETR